MTTLTYPAWIEFIFGRSVPMQGVRWYDEIDAPDWMAAPETKLSYLSRLFRESAILTHRFADRQIAQGLTYLIDNGAGDHTYAVRDAAVALPARRAFVESIADLFRDLFQPACQPQLSHLDKRGEHPLNTLCYMWWDIFPGFVGTSPDPALDTLNRAALSVMERTLQLPNTACQESALHGLGHWHHQYPHEVEQVIDLFLTSASPSPDLGSYARAARSGCVL